MTSAMSTADRTLVTASLRRPASTCLRRAVSPSLRLRYLRTVQVPHSDSRHASKCPLHRSRVLHKHIQDALASRLGSPAQRYRWQWAGGSTDALIDHGSRADPVMIWVERMRRKHTNLHMVPTRRGGKAHLRARAREHVASCQRRSATDCAVGWCRGSPRRAVSAHALESLVDLGSTRAGVEALERLLGDAFEHLLGKGAQQAPGDLEGVEDGAVLIRAL